MMECSARILREQKRLGHLAGAKAVTLAQFYCPVVGELVLSGEQAERAREHQADARAHIGSGLRMGGVDRRGFGGGRLQGRAGLGGVPKPPGGGRRAANEVGRSPCVRAVTEI